MNSNEIENLLRGAQGTPPPDATKEKIMTAAQAALSGDDVMPVRTAKRRITPGRTAKAAAGESVWTRLGALNVAALLMLAAMGGYFVYYYATKVYPQQNGETAKGLDGNEQPLPFAANELPATAEEKAKIAELIGQLSHDNFDTRERALQALIALGPKALPQLRAAASKDADTKALLQKAIRQIEHNRAAAELEKRWPGVVARFTEGEPFSRPSPRKWVRTQDRRALATALVELYPLLQGGAAREFVLSTLNVLADPVDRGLGQWEMLSGEAGAGPLEIIEKGGERTLSPKARELLAAKLTLNDGVFGKGVAREDILKLGVQISSLPDGKEQLLTHEETAAYWRGWWRAQQARLDWLPDTQAPTSANVKLWLAALTETADEAAATQRLVNAWTHAEVQAAVQSARRDGPLGMKLKRLETLAQWRNKGTLLALTGEVAMQMNPDGSDQRPLFTGPLAQATWGDPRVRNGALYMQNRADECVYEWHPGMPQPRRVTGAGARNLQWRESPRQVWCLARAPGVFELRLAIYNDDGTPAPVPEQLNLPLSGYSLSPDGQLAACVPMANPGTEPELLIVWNLANGTVRRLAEKQIQDAPVPTVVTTEPVWSESSQYLALATQIHGRQIWLFDRKSGTLRNVMKREWSLTSNPLWLENDQLAVLAIRDGGERPELIRMAPPFETLQTAPLPPDAYNTSTLKLDDGSLKLISSGEFTFDARQNRFNPMQSYSFGTQRVDLSGQTWTVYSAHNPAGASGLQAAWRSPAGEILPVTWHYDGVQVIRFADKAWTGWRK